MKVAATPIFLSHVLSKATPGFGGQSAFESETVNSICSGKSSNSSKWTLSNHIGTHVDAPYHFSDAGETVDGFDAGFWVFQAPCVLDIRVGDAELIEPKDWESLVSTNCDLLLLRTGFQKYRPDRKYWESNPGLSPEVGKWLREKRPSIRAIGFDFLSVTSFQHREIGRESHRALLDPARSGKPVLAIEDMDLSAIGKVLNRVWVAPLRVAHADGAPVTVLAWE